MFVWFCCVCYTRYVFEKSFDFLPWRLLLFYLYNIGSSLIKLKMHGDRPDQQ